MDVGTHFRRVRLTLCSHTFEAKAGHTRWSWFKADGLNILPLVPLQRNPRVGGLDNLCPTPRLSPMGSVAPAEALMKLGLFRWPWWQSEGAGGMGS